MSPRVFLKFGTTGIFAIAILYVVLKWNSESWQNNPLIQFAAILGLAVVLGLFFVLVILPKLGDAVGTVMYSSGEEVVQDEAMKAAASMAAGNYEGAIEHFKNQLKDKPDDIHAISEIAKTYADKLHEPDKAIAFLNEQIGSQEWSQDHAAFLLFRLVDVQAHMFNFEAAMATLEQVIGTFPDTRHSANARHKITELQESEFKLLQAARAAEQLQAPEPESDQETA